MLYWHWFIFAGILLIVEMLNSITFFLFLSISFIIMGMVLIFFPDININIQLVFISIFSIISIFFGYYTFKFKTKNYQNINDRMNQYIGFKIILLQNSENGVSKAKIGDTYWRILINEAKKGDFVKITSFKSTSFIAEKFF